MLKVKAIRTCFVNNRLIHAGEVVDIDDATAQSNRHLRVLRGRALEKQLEKEAAARGDDLDDFDDELDGAVRSRSEAVEIEEEAPAPQPRKKAKKAKAKAKPKPRPRARAARA